MPKGDRSTPFTILLLSAFSINASALTLDAQTAIDNYILEKKSSAAESAAKQMADAKHDVDELESRILPAIVALNRAGPIINKRAADIDGLEKYMSQAATRSVNPYSDPAWAAQARSQALSICCAIRMQPSLMREVQENLENGLQPLSASTLAKINEAAKRASVKGVPANASEKETDEIIPRRPFVSRPKEEDGPRKRRNSRGIISGLPDLQQPSLEELRRAPPPPTPAPPPAPSPAPQAPPAVSP